MKRIFLVFCAFLLMFTWGCAGFNANQAVSTASDVGLALVLKNNPQYKAPVLTVLKKTKAALEGGEITYDQLVVEVSQFTGSEYAYIVAIILSDLSTDKPLFETYLPLLDKYKADLLRRIDRYIMIASISTA